MTTLEISEDQRHTRQVLIKLQRMRTLPVYCYGVMRNVWTLLALTHAHYFLVFTIVPTQSSKNEYIRLSCVENIFKGGKRCACVICVCNEENVWLLQNIYKHQANVWVWVYNGLKPASNAATATTATTCY